MKPQRVPNISTTCTHDGCDAVVQASVPMYLTKDDEGWHLEGIGDEGAKVYCAEDHEITDPYHDDLSAWLDEQYPGTTWHGSDPHAGTNTVRLTLIKDKGNGK